MKWFVFFVFLVFLSGCTVSPPKPPEAKGEWVELNTERGNIFR